VVSTVSLLLMAVKCELFRGETLFLLYVLFDKDLLSGLVEIGSNLNCL
jgi:hypothetical protein